MLNINVGILGHVDSGKTSLCKALSTTASTAAFDKNPESKRRGITIDLGFSSFEVDQIPESRTDLRSRYKSIVFTLVDCPGHASLIKTIICGAQIIDMIVLVIDIKKGIQTQTAECIVIGQMTCTNLVVVINKIDLIPETEREAKIIHVQKILKAAMKTTKFKKISYVAISANIDADQSINVDKLIQVMLDSIEDPTEIRAVQSEKPFIFAVDHCFNLSSKGTVLTGTVIQGKLNVGEKQDSTNKITNLESFPKDLYYTDELPNAESRSPDTEYFILVNFNRPVCCCPENLVIASKLDTEISSKACRIAFNGKILICLSNPKYYEQDLPKLNVFKTKTRHGKLDRVTNSREIIVKGLFKKETNWSLFDNLKVILFALHGDSVIPETADEYDSSIVLWSITGVISGNFGQTGKCRVSLKDDLPEELVKRFSGKTKGNDELQSSQLKIDIVLRFKRFIFSKSDRFVQ